MSIKLEGSLSASLEQHRSPVTELVNREREKHQMHSKIYYDLGEGASVKNISFMQRKTYRKNRFRVELDLSEVGDKNLRWRSGKRSFS